MRSDRERLWFPGASHTLQPPARLHKAAFGPGAGQREPPWRALGCRKDSTPTAQSRAGPAKLAVRAGTVHTLPVPDISGARRTLKSLWNFLSISFLKCH